VLLLLLLEALSGVEAGAKGGCFAWWSLGAGELVIECGDLSPGDA
jgi:hypothetical protein